MEKEEIIRKELFDIISELKANQNIKSDVADASIEEMRQELEQTAVDLLVHSPEEVRDHIRSDYFEAVGAEALISPGIATVIEDSKDHIYLPYYQGDIGDETGTKVSSNTRFDLASITKLFTVLEALKLNQDGLFDVNQIVSDIDSSPYKTLVHVTIADLLRFKYELQTIGRIDEQNLSTAQFYRRLLRPKIGLNAHVYSDIPFIIAKTLMPNSRKFFTDYYEELGLLSVGYDLTGDHTGSDTFDAVADGKAREMMRLGIQPGHAGLYGTADDMIKVFDALNKGFLSKESVEMMLSPGTDERYTPMYDKEGNVIGQKPINRGMGVYIEHPEGLAVSEVIPGLSKYAFAITGYTGGYVSYDLQNGLSNVILANPATIAATQAKVLVNKVPKGNRYLLSRDGVPFKAGTTIVSNFDNGKKNINVYDEDGTHLETRPYTNMMNNLKKQQIFTLLKLRLTKRVALALANSDLLVEHIDEQYSGGKKF